MRNTLLHVRNVEPGQPLHLEGEEWDGLTFRKELIYADSFVKRNDTTHQEFTIDEMKLAHWERVGNEMIADGVKVPTPLKHTDSPEASRGHIIRYERGINSRGVPALYGIFKFRDAEAAKLAATTDISIYVPENPVYNGHGKKYEYPIRHVALTDYPVINKLEPFQPIAASYDEFDSAPLELGFLKDRGLHTAVAQIAGEGVGQNAQTKGRHRVAAGLFGGSAVLGAREARHILKRTGGTAIRAYKKGGIKRVGRAFGTFNKVTRIKAAAPTAGKLSKVARAVGRRIPLVGATSAAAGALFAAGAVPSGIKGAIKHSRKAKELSFKDIVCNLKETLSLDFNSLELGGPGSGPRKGVKRGPYNIDRAVGKVAGKVAEAGSGTLRRLLTGRVARYIAKGEAVNYLARKYRGDNENRRWSAYGAHGAAHLTVNRALRADKLGQEKAKYLGHLKKIEKLGGTGTAKAKLVADALSQARLRHGVATGTAALAAASTALTLRNLLKKRKDSESRKLAKRVAAGAGLAGLTGLAVKSGGIGLSNESLVLGGPGSGPRPKGSVAGKIDSFRKSNFFKGIKPVTRKLAKAVKAVARNPLTRVGLTGEAINSVTKRARGDNENRRAVSHSASIAGHLAVRNFKIAGRERRMAAKQAKRKNFNFVSGKVTSAPPKETMFNFVTGKIKRATKLKPLTSRAKLVAPAAASVAGLLGASLLLKKKKNVELSLGTPIVDDRGNLHAPPGSGAGGQFVKKQDSARSARTQRRYLHSLKPKKFHYEEIGNVPDRNSDESPREYKVRLRKFRNEHKVENPNYYKDFSEEDVKTDPVSSSHQAVKHAAMTTLGAGTTAAATTGAYVAGKHLVKTAKEESDLAGKATKGIKRAEERIGKATEAYIKAFKEHNQAKANVTRAKKKVGLDPKQRAAFVKEKQALADEASKINDAAKARVDKMKVKLERFKGFAEKNLKKPKVNFRTVKAFLNKSSIRKGLLGLAAASAAAAAATHETKQHFDAARYHAKNATGKIKKFRNEGLVRKG